MRWLPRATFHTVLRRLFSNGTRKWLKAQTDGEAVLNSAKGFLSEQDPLTGELRLYTGNYMLQINKALSVVLRDA